MAKNFSKKLDKNTSDGGHETHTTALVLMVLVTGLVLTIALGDTGTFGQAQDAAYPSMSSEREADRQHTDREEVTGQVAAAADPLSTIPVDPNVEVRNEMVTRGNQAVEQVISYETERDSTDLALEYRSWLTEHNYTTETERIGSYAATFAATREDSSLVVLISHLDAENKSRVEIINYRR